MVAHPPCARWCQLARLVQHVYGYQIGDDGGTFAAGGPISLHGEDVAVERGGYDAKSGEFGRAGIQVLLQGFEHFQLGE